MTSPPVTPSDGPRIGAPIPVTIIGGFLGAGKTTLLKRVLTNPHGIRFGVLVNDFGAINIDAELIVSTAGAAGAEQVNLANGCICCTIRDDLVQAARQLLETIPRPDHIIIETSGVSRPLAVADALEAGLGEAARMEAVFCLVDAGGFADLDFASTELAIDQAAASDIVIVNKCDQASAQGLDTLENTLTGASPRARLLRTTFAQVPFGILFGPDAALAPRQGVGPSAPADETHHHDHEGVCGPDCGHATHDHGAEFAAWHWRSAAPLDLNRFRSALRALPPGLLRVKGILAFHDKPNERGILQVVGRRAELETVFGPAPPQSSLVAVGRRGAYDAAALSRLFDECMTRG